MKPCDTCGAACCRFVVIEVGPMDGDKRWWANMRGRMEGGQWRIRSKCACLTADGKCSDYDNRPEVCKDLSVGGPRCMQSRKALREMGESMEPLASPRALRGFGWLVKLLSN